MKPASAVMGILLLLACVAPLPVCAGGDERAAELNGKYQLFLQCAREALQSYNIALPHNPFHAVKGTGPLACDRVYLRVDVPLPERFDADVLPMLRKNIFPVVARLNEILCDVLAHECCSGVVIDFHPNTPLATLGSDGFPAEQTSISLSKFDLKKLLSGQISVNDLLQQPFTILRRNGREIAVD
jgi:hypothetical protein